MPIEMWISTAVIGRAINTNLYVSVDNHMKNHARMYNLLQFLYDSKEKLYKVKKIKVVYTE